MNKAEFDQFADEYRLLHEKNITASGESLEYFAEYKVIDTTALAKTLGLEGALRVLDFGAGLGNSVPYFHKHFAQLALDCVDVSEKCLAINQTRFPGMAQCTSFDGRTLPYATDAFDIAFAACVFHHIDAAQHVALLQELYRVVKPGGLLVVFEHNPWNPLTRRAVNTCAFDANAVLMSAPTLCQRVRAAGFTQVKARYRIFFPGFLRSLRFLEPLLRNLPLGAQYYVAGCKR